MKPPICCICNKRIEEFENSGIIYFKKRKADVEWEKEMEETGKVGHPPYAEWFCNKHYSKAKKLSHLSINEALNAFKK